MFSIALDEEERSPAVALERHRRRRAVDHHDAQRDEQDRRDEEHPVRFELSRHPLQLDCVSSDNSRWTDATIVLAPPKS